jgi:hypothetical protein
LRGWRFDPAFRAAITNLLPYKAILSKDYETEFPKKSAMPKVVRKRTFAKATRQRAKGAEQNRASPIVWFSVRHS